MQIFGAESGKRFRLHPRGVFRKGDHKTAKLKPRATPAFTREELKAFAQVSKPAPKPLLLARIRSFFQSFTRKG